MPKKKKPAASEPTLVKTAVQARAWAAVRGVTEIECLVPDMAGVARGKIMPAEKFFRRRRPWPCPCAIFMQTMTRAIIPPETADFRMIPSDGDIELQPGSTTLRAVPWAADPTAQVIHDASTTTAGAWRSPRGRCCAGVRAL